MCGFVGYFGAPGRDLSVAAAAIGHRGPDMRGISSGRDWSVAFNRLSILDLSESAMQPFAFDDVVVYLNGEIYNYIELRDRHRGEFQWTTGCDVEIVPFLYRKYGPDFLHMLNGMFAMVIIDERSGKRLLARDRFGKKPLFHVRDRGDVLFASEIKALKPLVRLEADRTNVAINLTCWFLVQPLSLYKGVANVNPGCYLEIEGSRVVERRWYEPRIVTTERPLPELEETIMSLYQDSVKLRLRSDVPVGIYLSGGLDSMSMAKLSQAQSPGNFSALTARIEGKELWEKNDTDTEIVARYCEENQLPMRAVDVGFDYWNRNIVRIIGNYEELFTDMGVLVFYALAQAAHAAGVKVLFSGVGGDELFGGYPWQSRLRKVPGWMTRRGLEAAPASNGSRMYDFLSRLRNPLTGNRIASMYRVGVQPRVWHAQSLSVGFGPYLSDVDGEVAARIDALAAEYFAVAERTAPDDLMNRINYANVFTVLGNQNYEVDIASMRYSIENRSPLLDYRLVEYMLSVPDHVKVAEGHKGLMRRIARKLLPERIASAKKSGPSMPLDIWLADANFRRSVQAFLERHRSLIGDAVSGKLAQHIGSAGVHDGRSGALMTFALVSLVIWVRQNFTSSPIDEGLSFTELAAGA